jgi:hypothetical protein
LCLYIHALTFELFMCVCVVVGLTRKRADLFFVDLVEWALWSGLAEWARGDGSYLQGCLFLFHETAYVTHSSYACVANDIFPVACGS